MRSAEGAGAAWNTNGMNSDAWHICMNCVAASWQSSIVEIAGSHMRLEIGGELGDGERHHVVVEAAADLRHPLGDRHHGADRRSAARPAQQLDIGLAELRQRGRSTSRSGSKLNATLPCSSDSSSTMASNSRLLSAK